MNVLSKYVCALFLGVLSLTLYPSAPLMAADEAKSQHTEDWFKKFNIKFGEKIYFGKENLEAFQKDEKSLNVFLTVFVKSFVISYTATPKFKSHFDKKYGLGTSKKIDIPALTDDVVNNVVSRPHKEKLRVGKSETVWLDLMKLTVDLATKQLAIKAGLWKEPGKTSGKGKGAASGAAKSAPGPSPVPAKAK